MHVLAILEISGFQNHLQKVSSLNISICHSELKKIVCDDGHYKNMKFVHVQSPIQIFVKYQGNKMKLTTI